MAETLRVDPRELVELAANLATVVGQARNLVPPDTVRAAGGDDISAAGAQRLNMQAALVANLISEGLTKLTAAAYAIGDAGERYSKTDAAGRDATANTRATSAPASEVITNPVGPWAPIPPRDVPAVSGLPGVYIDPEEFAQQLQGGDRGQSAINFSGSWSDDYVGAAHPMTDAAVVETANGAGRWEPVGARVATLFGTFRAWHDEVGRNYAAMLARQADVYLAAFDDVTNAHPTVDTIRTAKRRYETAMPGPEKTAALVHLFEVYQQAWQAQQQYGKAIATRVSMDIGVGPPPDIASQTTAAVDTDIGPPRADRETRTASGGNGNTLNKVLSGVLNGLPGALQLAQALGSTGDTIDTPLPAAPDIQPPTVPSPTPTPTPTPGIEQPANSGGIPQIPDLSQLANQGLNDGPPSDEGLLEDPYLEDLYPLDDYSSGPGGYGGGGGLGGGGRVSESAAGGVPLFGATSSRAPQLPGARQFGGPAAGGRSQAAGAGGMPYMPYMPGMGGANPNGGGDRKNPFAGEQMFVDADKLRSEVLASATVNEKPPVLPPDATRPTLDRTSAADQGRKTA